MNINSKPLLTLFVISAFGFLYLFVKPASAYAATYYVDGTLSGTCVGGAGTSYSVTNRDCSSSGGIKAFKNFHTAFTSANIAQGDTVYVRAGTYNETDTSMSLGAGSGPVTVTPYNGESVIIDPGALTNYMWFNPSYDLIIDGGPTRSLTFQNTSGTTKSIFYLVGGSTMITRTVITDSANRTSTGWLQDDGNARVKTVTLSRNLIHDIAGFFIFSGGGTFGSTINVYANQMDAIHAIINVYRAGITLNETNNTVVRATGILHNLGQNVSVNSINNIFVLKTGGSSNQLFEMGATALSSWNFKNNIVWRESITDYTDYSDIINSGTYIYNINKSNKFVNPTFVNYGTGYSNADLRLQDISTNYATGRGLGSSLPSGGDYTGTSWPVNDNSVGCYINPTLVPNPNPTLTNKVAFTGDSIMTGAGASDIAHTDWKQFSSLTGLPTVNTAFGGGDIAAITGQHIEGAEWLIDRTIFEGAPKTAFISIGVNNLNNGSPASATSEELAQGVKVIFDKLTDAGITPIWLGAESKIGNPPDNTATVNFNSAVMSICTTYGMTCGSILDQMMNDINWKTDYYNDLTSNPHPNDAGHLLIANLAVSLYAKLTTQTSSNASSSNSPSSLSCSDSKPEKSPQLFQIETTKNKATLYFSPSGNNTSSYFIAYGYDANDDRFGTRFDYGKSDGAVQYAINDLEPNKTYYFKVRAGNGCATGDWSNTLHATTLPKDNTFGTKIFTAWEEMKDVVLGWMRT